MSASCASWSSSDKPDVTHESSDRAVSSFDTYDTSLANQRRLGLHGTGTDLLFCALTSARISGSSSSSSTDGGVSRDSNESTVDADAKLNRQSILARVSAGILRSPSNEQVKYFGVLEAQTTDRMEKARGEVDRAGQILIV